MNQHRSIAVTSRAFSKNPVLRQELLALYPNTKFNDAGAKLEGDVLIQYLADCDSVIAGLEKFDASIFTSLPKLKVISRFGVGLDGVDLQAMNQYQVRLGWSPDVNYAAVAELTLTFMLALLRKSFATSYQLKNGAWNKVGGYQLAGKTVGIVGLGRIGREVIRLLQPFQCTILASDIMVTTSPSPNVQMVALDTLVRESDIISLHVPLTASTTKMINAFTLSMMKNTACLINTARGGLVDQEALKQALKNQQIAGAALDVFEEEPPTDNEFLQMPNLICTPHIGGNSFESELNMGRAAILGLSEARLPEQIFGKKI